jgi:tetratricopeptide (TPR) repeat protein
MGRQYRLLVALTLFSVALTGNLFPQINTQSEIQAHYQQAKRDFQANRLNDAKGELTAILKLDPNDGRAYYDLAGIAYQEGDNEKAAQSFRSAFKLNPSLRDAQAFLGICEMSLGQTQSAEEDLAASFPHITDPPLRKQVLEDLVQLYYNDQNLKGVVGILRGAGQADLKDPELLYDAYRVYTQLASQALSSLVHVAPQSPRLHEIIAEDLMNRRDFHGAIAEYEKAIDENPRLSGVHFELGQAILAGSQTLAARAEAKKEFESELSVDPSNPYAEYGLGEIFWLNSNGHAALEHFSRAVKLSPSFADAQIDLGRVQMSLGAVDGALAHFSAAARLEPQNAQVHYQLALAYRKLGRLHEADREMAAFENLQKARISPLPDALK